MATPRCASWLSELLKQSIYTQIRPHGRYFFFLHLSSLFFFCLFRQRLFSGEARSTRIRSRIRPFQLIAMVMLCSNSTADGREKTYRLSRGCLAASWMMQGNIIFHAYVSRCRWNNSRARAHENTDIKALFKRISNYNRKPIIKYLIIMKLRTVQMSAYKLDDIGKSGA